MAIGAFGDSFGLPSSGEIVLLAAAAAAANTSEFSLPLVVLVAWAFALAGDLCAYAIGRAAGPGVLRRFGVHEDSSVHVFMARYGARAVAGGRLIAGIRTKLAIVSGSTRMPFHRYLLADALGAAVWAILVGATRLPVLELRGDADRPLRLGQPRGRRDRDRRRLGAGDLPVRALRAAVPPGGCLAGNRLEHRVGDVEVGVDVLHVVVVLERVDQTQQLAGGVLLQRDGILRHQGQLGRSDRQA